MLAMFPSVSLNVAILRLAAVYILFADLNTRFLKNILSLLVEQRPNSFAYGIAYGIAYDTAYDTENCSLRLNIMGNYTTLDRNLLQILNALQLR